MPRQSVLLAKKPSVPGTPPERETLVGHTRDVLQTGREILNLVGVAALRILGLGECFEKDLRLAVLLGILLHDLGKANSHFQRLMLRGGTLPQALRHEWISAWLPLAFEELDRWLFAGRSDRIRYGAIFAALGHHLKVEGVSSIRAQEGSGDATVQVYCSHSCFRSCLNLYHDILSSSASPPMLDDAKIDLLVSPLMELRSWLRAARRWYEQASDDDRRFVSLVKAIVLAADVAGSAVPMKGFSPEEWTRTVLSRLGDADELSAVARTRLGCHTPRSFQQEVASSSARVTFLRAGCGSGKTIAAYMWASKRAARRKLFFCYPTTGTATEGFRDYIIPSEMAEDAALIHSRSDIDLEGILDSHEADINDALFRIDALRAWDAPVVLCTVDTVLGIVQNSRVSLFSFPSIANGAFVFDEVHMYDDRLFGALLCFLDTFMGAPILLMTASLQPARLEAIRDLLQRRGERLRIIEGPVELERIPRYLFDTTILDEPPWEGIGATIRNGGKVLLVANTVDRCVSLAQEAAERGLSPIPYHSRYRYCDRVEKHNKVIEAFKSSTSALAVTTQVCEVSLDLSADLLVTEIAPIPALIQRMGRLNRRVTPEAPGILGHVYFLAPPSEAPYSSDEIDSAKKWIKYLGSKPLSQEDLSSSFELITQGPNKRLSPMKSAWLDDGPFSTQAPVRKATENITVVMEEDVPACRDCGGRPVMKEVGRFSIPMPLGPVDRKVGVWGRIGFAFIAPKGTIEYSREWGAKWAEGQNVQQPLQRLVVR